MKQEYRCGIQTHMLYFYKPIVFLKKIGIYRSDNIVFEDLKI